MTSDDLAAEGDLPDRIRSEAAIADRPGQLARLEAIADEVAAALRDRQRIIDCNDRQAESIMRLRVRAETAEALFRFAGHEEDCDQYGERYVPPDCKCGYTAVLIAYYAAAAVGARR